MAKTYKVIVTIEQHDDEQTGDEEYVTLYDEEHDYPCQTLEEAQDLVGVLSDRADDRRA
jgi:hypothetical protein